MLERIVAYPEVPLWELRGYEGKISVPFRARLDGSFREGTAAVGAPPKPDGYSALYTRYQARSTILTSHQPVSRWHERIGDPTPADGILDFEQLLNGASASGDAEIIRMVLERVDWPRGDGRWFYYLWNSLQRWPEGRYLDRRHKKNRLRDWKA